MSERSRAPESAGSDRLGCGGVESSAPVELSAGETPTTSMQSVSDRDAGSYLPVPHWPRGAHCCDTRLKYGRERKPRDPETIAGAPASTPGAKYAEGSHSPIREIPTAPRPRVGVMHVDLPLLQRGVDEPCRLRGLRITKTETLANRRVSHRAAC